MRLRRTLIMVAGLAGLVTVSVAAMPSPRVPHDANGGAALAATQDSVQDREQYMRETAAQVEKWRQQVEAFSSRALAARTPESLATRERILSEWSLVETTWHVLGVSYGTAWEEAQVSFQQASDSFTRTWREQVPDEN